MAGSAGSPPVLTVYVKPTYAVSLSKRGTDWQPVEYVPREQSDALAEALESVTEDCDEWARGNWDDGPVSAAKTAHKALDSYREATAGEDGK